MKRLLITLCIFFLKNLTALNEDEDSRYLQSFSLACLASLAGFFASATFLSVLYYAHYWYLTGMIVAAVCVAKSLSFKQDSRLVTSAR